MVEFEPALNSLTAEKVDFVIGGGLAVSAHSTGYITIDLDFCYLRTRENLIRVVAALAPFKPRFRHYPENLPFVRDERTLQNGTDFTLVTDIGDFEAVKKESIVETLYDCKVRILTIEGLIKAKRAAGRAKDLLVLPELEAIREMLSETEEL